MSGLIKICGITSSEDARMALEAGADFLGLIFVPDTPRAVTIEVAQTIQAGFSKAVKWVGVFQNQDLKTLQEVAASVHLDFIQLHGDEDPDFCRKCPKPVIKTLLLAEDDPSEADLQFLTALAPVDYLLVDLPKGSERRLPEALTPAWRAALKSRHFLLAGKLTADTVAGMIESCSPAGVDVASGVEVLPGRKNPQQVNAFCRAARQAFEMIGVR